MRFTSVFVDRERRFSLDVEEETGGTYVVIPVSNQLVDYEEHYAVDPETFARYRADPALAHDFVASCKRREQDHLLLRPPGRDRGTA